MYMDSATVITKVIELTHSHPVTQPTRLHNLRALPQERRHSRRIPEKIYLSRPKINLLESQELKLLLTSRHYLFRFALCINLFYLFLESEKREFHAKLFQLNSSLSGNWQVVQLCVITLHLFIHRFGKMEFATQKPSFIDFVFSFKP